MAALKVKIFKKMAYKDFKKGKKNSKRGSSSSNSDRRNFKKNDEKESRSGKIDKSKALITKKMNLDDTSESDEGTNYALMANADGELEVSKMKGSRPHGLIQTTSEEPGQVAAGTWVGLTDLLGICEMYITVCKGEHNRSAVPRYE
ncbi:hypothetical protein AgCh_031747 [Apium graveolens]